MKRTHIYCVFMVVPLMMTSPAHAFLTGLFKNLGRDIASGTAKATHELDTAIEVATPKSSAPSSSGPRSSAPRSSTPISSTPRPPSPIHTHNPATTASITLPAAGGDLAEAMETETLLERFTPLNTAFTKCQTCLEEMLSLSAVEKTRLLTLSDAWERELAQTSNLVERAKITASYLKDISDFHSLTLTTRRVLTDAYTAALDEYLELMKSVKR